MAEKLIIREAGLRDGVQIIKSRLTTDQKIAWIDQATAAGFSEMEVTSLVPAKYLPQFHDAAEVIHHCQSIDMMTASVLVPNLKGAQRALEAGAKKITFIVSASEKFSFANVRHSSEESLRDFDELISLCRDAGDDRPQVVGGLSCAFGCTLEGRVPEKHVLTLTEKLLAAGADEIVLADTVGYGDPTLVRNIVGPAMKMLEGGSVPLGLHFHDTRGQGLANVAVAMDEGVRLFDAALGGIGGCPNSPGATGNIATEDLAFMAAASGFDTGLDFEKLIDLRRWVESILPEEKFYGHLSQVGLPNHFQPSVAQKRNLK